MKKKKKKNKYPKPLTFGVWDIKTNLGKFGPKAFSKRLIIMLLVENPTISDKNCETGTPSCLIQCWLQICLSFVVSTAWYGFFQAWYNIASRKRGNSG